MNSIDKWAAEKCGVVIDTSAFEQVQPSTWTHRGVTYRGRWTIKDPLCREKFRTWWLQDSPADKPRSVRFDTDKVYYGEWDEVGCKMLFSGDDEEDCITAIYEAENTQEEPSNGNGDD